MTFMHVAVEGIKYLVSYNSSILLDLGVIILLSTLLGLVASTFKQPMIPVYILVGILLKYLSSSLLSFDKSSFISISELGIAFLLFLIGMEFDIGKIKDILGFAIIGTVIQLLLTSSMFVLLFSFFGISLKESILVAIALSFSSTALVVKYLSDKGTMDTTYGRNVLAMLLTQDLFVTLLLPFISPSTLDTSLAYHILDVILKGSGLIGLALGINRFIIKPLMKYYYTNVDISLLLSLSVMFIFSLISSVLGFSIAIGSFIGGLAAAAYPYSYRVTQRIAHLRDFFIFLFFVAVGFQISLKDVSSQTLLLSGIVIVFTLFLKPFIYMIPSFLFGNDAKNSLQLGIMLSQTSEFSLILAAVAYSQGLISSSMMTLICLVFFFTSFISSYFIQWSSYISLKFFKFFEIFERMNLLKGEESVKDKGPKRRRGHVIIYGINALTKMFLERGNIDIDNVVIVCDDIYKVRVLRKEGYDAVLGSIDDEELLKDIGIERAAVLVYANKDFKEQIEAITVAKSLNRFIRIIGRSNNFHDALKLYNGGIDFVLIDGKHNYEDLRRVIDTILTNKEEFTHLKEKEIEHINKVMEKEILALNLPEELQEIKKKVVGKK